jgi:hypothetical protein
MKSVAIHYNPAVKWQAQRVSNFADGLRNIGVTHKVTTQNYRVSDVAILFGTTYWRRIEDDQPWMLVDRASVGDPEYVSLVWNGHGRRGDHMVPANHNGSRWKDLGVELQPASPAFPDTVICGQTEPYSPDWKNMYSWYNSIVGATHFRPHPAAGNPTALPIKRGWDANFHVLNSSVGVEAAIRGCPLVVHDEGCMAHGIQDRQDWANWLAWTQWSWDEIRQGKPIQHLFEAI